MIWLFFFAPAQNVKNCIFSDAWGLMGRIVINLCLGVYFAYSEDEELGVVDSV